MEAIIATGCYTNIPKGYPGAISISCSSPRFYGSVLKISDLAPRGFKDDPMPMYLAKYAKLLAGQDPQTIVDRARELVTAKCNGLGVPPVTPVLLCWERPGQFCHRRLAAKWLESKLEIKVPEVKLYGGKLFEVPERCSLASPPAPEQTLIAF